MSEKTGSRILVIDDDRDMLKMLEAMLVLDGFSVSLCSDPDKGLATAAEELPDLILLDMVMPRKSGLEVMMEIRSSPATSRIPILFLSAVGEEAVVVKALKGADDYVIKPFKTLELEARILKILERTAHGDGVPADRPAKLQRLPVHGNHAQEGIAIDGEARAGLQLRGDAGGLQVSLAVHEGGDSGSAVAAGVGIVRQPVGHKQGAQVRIAEPQGTEVV